MLARSARLTLALALVALIPAASAHAASIWTQVPSGTSQTISSIAIPKPGQVVYATTGGEIHYLTAGGTFASATLNTANPTGFSSIAMSADGAKGVAVGPGASIYSSSDAGHTWTKLTTPIPENAGFCRQIPATPGTVTDDLYSVKFAGASTVYATGNNGTVLKSTDGGLTFTEVNKKLGASCVADPGVAEAEDSGGQGFTDSYWLDAAHGYLLSNYFGQYSLTTDGFATASTKTTNGVNGTTSIDKLAVKAGDPSHAWAVGGGTQNGSYFKYTTDGGSTWNTPKYDTNQVSLKDVATAGDSVIAVGAGGDIYTSIDGLTFTRQPAGGFPSNEWDAVALQDAATAYVGGAGGLLVKTTAANLPPGYVAPVGTSGGTTTTTQGSTVVIYKTVTVTGRKGRYIPVVLSAKKPPRRFVVTLLSRAKKPKTLTTLKVTLANTKAKTVKLTLPKTVKAGSYQLVVKIYTTGRHARQVGKSVKQVFILI